MPTDKKEIILKNLQYLKQIELNNKQPFKARAYGKVIQQIQTMDCPITDVSDLEKLDGIGKSIHAKIVEIIENGHLDATKGAIEDTHHELNIMEDLMKIQSIGPVKAKDLITNHGIKSIEDLRNHQDLLNDKQRLGLKYYEDINQRIPRAEMVKHYNFIKKTIDSISDNTVQFEITGSFRRGLSSSGDIDLLITYDPKSNINYFDAIIESLKKQGYLVDDFGFGEKKYMGMSKLPRHKHNRRIDIMYTEPSRYPFALLYFTGSQKFNIAMRNRALELGYSLNEYGLKKAGSEKTDVIKKQFASEQEVFDFLRIRYVSPEDRETTDSLCATS